MKNYKEILEEIAKTRGLKVIEDFIKEKRKGNRKKRGRPLSSLLTGAEVYYDMFGIDINNKDSYSNFVSTEQIKSITEAKECIADKNNILPKTVDSHVTRFNKYAENIYSFLFCEEFEEWYKTANDYGYINDIDKLDGYIYRYNKNNLIGQENRIIVALYLRCKYYKVKEQKKFIVEQIF